MCHLRLSGSSRGFTLIELLIVIAIIGILAGLLLPVLAIVRTRAKVGVARREMQSLNVAISLYQGDHSRYPCSAKAEKVSVGGDFTFGTWGITLSGAHQPILSNLGYETNNSELVMILLGVEGPGNPNNMRNPRKTRYWDPRMVTGNTSGVSREDYIARDPWGSAYIMTIDSDNNGRCMDAHYRKSSVSERQQNDNTGFFGLSRRQPGDNFELSGPVMIWSAGPDGSYNPGDKANAGFNRDNLLSWSN